MTPSKTYEIKNISLLRNKCQKIPSPWISWCIGWVHQSIEDLILLVKGKTGFHIHNFYALITGRVQIGTMRILQSTYSLCTHAALFENKNLSNYLPMVGNDKKIFDILHFHVTNIILKRVLQFPYLFSLKDLQIKWKS